MIQQSKREFPLCFRGVLKRILVTLYLGTQGVTAFQGYGFLGRRRRKRLIRQVCVKYFRKPYEKLV
jgi:hypothetical protein